jgi:hypothetical protein
MMRLFKYSKMFSLKAMHRYYTSALSKDLVFAPSVETAKWLSKYSLIFKATETGFDVWGETGEDGLLKKKISQNIRLTFFITVSNPYFDNFTDLPIDRGNGSLLYFNNLTVNQVDVFNLGKIELLLNQGNQAGLSDYVRLVTGPYYFAHTAAGPSKIYRLVREEDDVLLGEETFYTDQGVFHYRNRMDEISSGRLRLEADGAVIDRFYFQPDPAVKYALGVVEIFTEVPDALRFVTNAGEISVKEYAVAFLNRSTLWRYKVTNRTGVSLPNPGIAIGNNTGLFTNTGSLTFVSNTPMPLQQAPVGGIRILKEAGNLSSEALGNLSNAGVERIIPESNNGSYTLYSDIFIYL